MSLTNSPDPALREKILPVLRQNGLVEIKPGLP